MKHNDREREVIKKMNEYYNLVHIINAGGVPMTIIEDITGFEYWSCNRNREENMINKFKQSEKSINDYFLKNNTKEEIQAKEKEISELKRQLEKAINFINSNIDLKKVGICKSCRYRDYPCSTNKYCKPAIKKYLEEK